MKQMLHSILHITLPLVLSCCMAMLANAQPFAPQQQVETAPAEGPSSSLYASKMAQRAALSLPGPMGAPSTGSWYETPVPPPKEVKRGDLIKIRVDLGSRLTSDGQIQRRKNSQYDALLNDWVILNGLRNVKPDPQKDGDQRIRGTNNQLYRATGDLETSESIKFNITATVVDILPNGNVVLEAHWKINSNNEQWMRSLSGIVARESIGPGNLVLGEDVADLHIGKDERGHVYDAYKRGWITKLLDVFSPF